MSKGLEADKKMVKIIDYSNPDVRKYAAESIIQTTAEFIKNKADVDSAAHDAAESLINLVADTFLLEGKND
jgi:2',3'-cyclic-nucleotide 2'-phosphodiesterase (5'-nucleotidase family)